LAVTVTDGRLAGQSEIITRTRYTGP